MTIAVPGDQATLNAALAFLDDYLIGNATVTIQLNASATFAAPVVVSHRDGERIKITGSSAARPTLTFSTTAGIIVLGRLGELSNLIIQGSDQPAGQRGLTLSKASHTFISNVDVNDFSTGVEVSGNSTLTGNTVLANSCGNAGVFVYDGGNLQVQNVTLTANGSGLLVERGGVATILTLNAATGNGFGISCTGGKVYTFAGSVNGGSNAILARDGCFVDASALTIGAGSTSPAVNTVASNNAFIKD